MRRKHEMRKQIHTKFKQYPINIKNYTAHPHEMVHVPAKFRENTAMRFQVSAKTFLKQYYFFLPKNFKQNRINIKNYTAHPHHLVHVPAKFRENTAMRFRVTVRKLNVKDGGGGGGVAISPVLGLRCGGR